MRIDSFRMQSWGTTQGNTLFFCIPGEFSGCLVFGHNNYVVEKLMACPLISGKFLLTYLSSLSVNLTEEVFPFRFFLIHKVFNFHSTFRRGSESSTFSKVMTSRSSTLCM